MVTEHGALKSSTHMDEHAQLRKVNWRYATTRLVGINTSNVKMREPVPNACHKAANQGHRLTGPNSANSRRY